MQDQSSVQKPIGAIFVNALELSAIKRKTITGSVVTNFSFHEGSSATIFLKDGTYDISLTKCSASTIDAADCTSVILMLTPAADAA